MKCLQSLIAGLYYPLMNTKCLQPCTDLSDTALALACSSLFMKCLASLKTWAASRTSCTFSWWPVMSSSSCCNTWEALRTQAAITHDRHSVLQPMKQQDMPTPLVKHTRQTPNSECNSSCLYTQQMLKTQTGCPTSVAKKTQHTIKQNFSAVQSLDWLCHWWNMMDDSAVNQWLEQVQVSEDTKNDSKNNLDSVNVHRA